MRGRYKNRRKSLLSSTFFSKIQLIFIIFRFFRRFFIGNYFIHSSFIYFNKSYNNKLHYEGSFLKFYFYNTKNKKTRHKTSPFNWKKFHFVIKNWIFFNIFFHFVWKNSLKTWSIFWGLFLSWNKKKISHNFLKNWIEVGFFHHFFEWFKSTFMSCISFKM